MKSRDLKSLCKAIAHTVDETEPKQLSEGYINSLTEKAHQVGSSLKEPIKPNPLAKPKPPKPPKIPRDFIYKPRPRDRDYVKEEETHLAEKAAPGYEDWASNPKVKASFKKQYGKDWEKVMYGHSWNMKKMDEETELEEGIIGNIIGGVKSLFKPKNKPLAPLPPGGRRLSTRSRPGAKPRPNKLSESEQLDELSDTLLFRARAKAKGVGKFKVRTNPSFAGSSRDIPLHKKITQELQRRGSVPVSESEQLDELSNRLLHRAKYAAWVKHKLSKKTGEALDQKINRELIRRGDVHADPPRRVRGVYTVREALEGCMGEDVQLNELSDAFLSKAGRSAVVRSFKDIMKAKFLGGDMKRAKRSHRVARNLHNANMKRLRGLGEESEQLDEISDALKSRAASKAYSSLQHSVTASHGSGSNREQAAKTAKKRLRQVGKFTGKKTSMPPPDLVVVSEAGYKRLGRIKKAAYAAQDKAYRSFTADQNKPAKLARAAAEREAQVAAGMARRGGASQEAVRGGGSRIGKSGKYTQKAGALANQRDKALASFRMKARTAQLFDRMKD